jgi:molybdopterin-binding protein
VNKLGARNQLKGRIVDVKKAELGLKAGDEAYAVIKASDVMAGK